MRKERRRKEEEEERTIEEPSRNLGDYRELSAPAP